VNWVVGLPVNITLTSETTAVYESVCYYYYLC